MKLYEVRYLKIVWERKYVYLKLKKIGYVFVTVMSEWWAYTSLFLYVSKMFQNKDLLVSVHGENQSSGDEAYY